jgi:small subunit ribosomal protein S1
MPGEHPMLALLNDYEATSQIQRGDVVTGTIALVNDHEMLIDVGAKSEGILAAREFSEMTRDQRESFVAGQNVECLVVNTEDRTGHIVVSLAQAKQGADWERAQQLFETDVAFEETISGHNKGGLIVHVGSVRGFVPISQIDRRHVVDRSRIDGSVQSPLAPLVGGTIIVKVMELDRRKNRLILSEQAAMREHRRRRKEELLDQLESGQIVTGVVTSLADFGAFVDIGGADGLVHLSELSWHRVTHPREVVQLGDTVTVKVISVDRERRRIGLSMKQLEPEPHTDLEERYPVGTLVQGEIVRLTDFGAFAQVDGDVEGLIHVSELADEERPPEETVTIGQQLELRVIRVDTDKKRLGLSLKRAGEEFDALADESAAASAAVASNGSDGVADGQPADDVSAAVEAEPVAAGDQPEPSVDGAADEDLVAAEAQPEPSEDGAADEDLVAAAANAAPGDEAAEPAGERT